MKKINLFVVLCSTILICTALTSCDKEGEIKESKGIKAKAIDLGLSVKWASWNIGASKPEDNGNYYAWGEITTKSNYDPETYKYCYCDEKDYYLTKYCTNSGYGYNGFSDMKIVLDLTDDIAHIRWKGSWRIPSNDDWQELINKCKWTYVANNGVRGYKIVGPNGNSIFLSEIPAAIGTTIDFSEDDYYGAYWSNSLYKETEFGENEIYPESAHCLFFKSDYHEVSGFGRYVGLPIRPVCSK